jgi:hypothetical protein
MSELLSLERRREIHRNAKALLASLEAGDQTPSWSSWRSAEQRERAELERRAYAGDLDAALAYADQIEREIGEIEPLPPAPQPAPSCKLTDWQRAQLRNAAASMPPPSYLTTDLASEAAARKAPNFITKGRTARG